MRNLFAFAAGGFFGAGLFISGKQGEYFSMSVLSCSSALMASALSSVTLPVSSASRLPPPRPQ